jgi:hypothetical protein
MAARYEPLYDIDPRTGAAIEVFYADRALETFGWQGGGWFWCSRRRGFAAAGSLRSKAQTLKWFHPGRIGDQPNTFRSLRSRTRPKQNPAAGGGHRNGECAKQHYRGNAASLAECTDIFFVPFTGFPLLEPTSSYRVDRRELNLTSRSGQNEE